MSSLDEKSHRTEAELKLLAENAEFRARLEEAEDTLRAIRDGEVDGLIVDGDPGPQVFILQSSDAESNRFRSDILSKVSEAVVALDEGDRVIYFNAAAEVQYGIPATGALGQILGELYDCEWVHAEDEAISRQSLEETGHWRGENIHIRRDGKRIHVESSVSRMIGKDGKRAGMLSVIRDITGRRTAEAALRESEERYRTLFNSIDEGFCIVEVIFDDADQPVDYRFLQISPSFEKHTGLHGAIGRTMREFAPNHEDYWFQIYGGVARGGEPVRFEHHASALGRWYDVFATRFGAPEKSQVAVIFNDITRRKEIEDAQRRNEALFVTLIDQAPGGVYVVDENLRSVQVNSAARPMFANAEPLIGKEMTEVMHVLWGPEQGEAIAEALRVTQRTGEPFLSPRFTATRADTGETESYDWEIRRLTLPSGAYGVVCYFMNMTEQRKLEDALLNQARELELADRRKNEFLAMLAHELRNPLAPLRNAAEVLQVEDAPARDRASAQRLIRRQIENMTRLIDDLLDVSRITEGKIELKKQVTVLQSVLNSSVSLVRTACAANAQQLTVSLPDQPVYLDADPTRLEQIFGNLLGNAAKYGGDGCHISLAAIISDDGKEIIVSVSDDGTGIDEDVLPRIFDLFVQSSRTLDRAHGGLGIGLTIVQRLVRMHEGTITAHSDGLGKGSEFVVSLPIMKMDGPKPVAIATPAPKKCGFRMLIVDDNRDSADSMALLQDLSGHETRVAHSGPDGLALAAEFLPQVVLLDIGLPGMDGYEVARRLRAMPPLADCFLVAMTGYGSDEDRELALQAGFDRHLVKPADLNLLRRWLEERM